MLDQTGVFSGSIVGTRSGWRFWSGCAASSACPAPPRDGGGRCRGSTPTPAPTPPSAPRSPARAKPPACSPNASASAPRPSASGASAARGTAWTAPRRRTSCLGRPRTRSASWSARCAAGFALDDLTFVAAHFLPHLNRDSVWRILRAEGLSRRTPPPSSRPKRGQGSFRDYDLGFVHIDIKHLPKLQTANGERRKRYLYVAIACLRGAAAAFPFRLTRVLTDNGSCSTP